MKFRRTAQVGDKLRCRYPGPHLLAKDGLYKVVEVRREEDGFTWVWLKELPGVRFALFRFAEVKR